MSLSYDDFLRRYATTPIHVPRLERLLAVYEADGRHGTFVERFIEWDRACADVDAARIVTEILSTAVDEEGRIRRVSDAAVQGAIRWMADARSLPATARAAILRDGLASRDAPATGGFIAWLETAPALDEAQFRADVESLAAQVMRLRA